MKKIILFGLLLTLFLVGCSCTQSINDVSKTLSTYKMNIIYNDNTKTLQVEQQLTYKNSTNTMQNELCFHLYPKAFAFGAVNGPVGILSKPKAYPNGNSYGDIVINNAQVDNKASDYQFGGVDKNILKLQLQSSLSPDAKTTINFDYTVTLPNINHRFGYGENTINVANFYPILAVYENGEWICDPYDYKGDPFYSNMANYEISLTAPTTLVLATTGEILSKTTNNNQSTYNISAKAVRDYAFVLSSKFEIKETIFNNIKVKYYYYNDDCADEYLQVAVDSLKTFNNLFGEYPYSTLSVVKCNFVHGGMEYPNLVYISDAVSHKESYINVIVHEIAHQWWYGLVGSNAYRYPWLDEGLTEYSTILFYENNPQYGINPKEILQNTASSYTVFIDLYTAVLGKVDTSMSRALNEYSTEPEYVYITYIKGMLFFDSLREVIGEKAFMKGLKQYNKNFMFKNVTPSHLLDTFERASRQKLDGFFDSWISGKVSVIRLKG